MPHVLSQSTVSAKKVVVHLTLSPQSEPSFNQRRSRTEQFSPSLLKTEAFIFIHPNGKNATYRGITDKLQQPDKRVSLWQSPAVSAKAPQCGRCLWESGWQRIPLGEGQASLGEALVTVHTCRLLLQPRRRFKVQSPTCILAPKGRTVHGGHGCQCF